MEGVGYMKTVRQLSEQLGIAKQSVDYHVKKLNESYIKEGNVNMIDDRLEQLIIERVNNNKQHTTQHTTDEQQQASDSVGNDNKNDTSTNTNVEDREDTNKNTQSNNYNIDPIAILQSHITLLSSQLDKKDNQLDKAQELIDQQQRLAIDQSNKVRELEKELKVYKQLEYNKEVQQQEVATNTKQDIENADVKDVSDTNIDNVKEDKPKGFFAKLFNL